MSEPKTIHIQLTPETVRFYKQAAAEARRAADPRNVTQQLLTNLDATITEANLAGFPTAGMTDALDELWLHLKDAGQLPPVSEEHDES